MSVVAGGAARPGGGGTCWAVAGIANSEPRLLLGDRKRLARLEGRDPGVPTLEIESEFEKLAAHAPGAPLPDVPIAEDDPAVILYTSGTTGRAKGAVNTHRGLCGFVQLNLLHGVRLMLAAAAASAFCGCLDPMIFRAHVRPMGEMTAAAATKVAAADVRLFMDAAPPGIVKSSDGIAVEPGYAHQVLGRVEVKTEDGDCEMEKGESPGAHIVREMQRAAASAGCSC